MLDTPHCRQAGGIFKAAPAVASVAALALAAGLSASSAWAHEAAMSPALFIVGQFEVPIEGLTTDVWAYGNYAYLGSFSTPFCSFDLTGVRLYAFEVR